MKTTLLLMSLGFLGYTWYNKYYGNKLAGAASGAGNMDSSSNTSRAGENVNFSKKIESQVEKGEGLTDESKTGIED